MLENTVGNGPFRASAIFPAIEVFTIEKSLKARGHHTFGVGRRWGFEDLDVLERYTITVAKPGNVTSTAFGPLVLGVLGAEIVEICAEDNLTIEFHDDPGTGDSHLFVIPFTDGLESGFFSRCKSVERAVELIVLEGAVFRVGIIENLNLHPDVGPIARARVMDAQPIVSASRELVIELQNVVRKRLLGD